MLYPRYYNAVNLETIGYCHATVKSEGMCKEMQVIPVNRVVDKKRIIGKIGGPRRRKGTSGH
jgi:hypothetical protein